MISNEGQIELISTVCQGVVKEVLDVDPEAEVSWRMHGYVGCVNAMHSQVYLSYDPELSLLEATFQYEDPTPGDVKSMIIDCAGDTVVLPNHAEPIADQLG